MGLYKCKVQLVTEVVHANLHFKVVFCLQVWCHHNSCIVDQYV